MMLQKSLLCIWMLLGLGATAAPGWQLVKEGHGIKIYAAAGSADFKSIKAVAVFDGTPEKFLAILLDVDDQPKWVYGTRQSYILQQVNNREILYYVETDLPWPAHNRDVVVRMKIKENRANRSLKITSVGEPQALPVRERNVRVPHFAATWEVKAVAKNKISLTYLLEINPGGSLPAWIVNLFVSKGPYESLRNLAEKLKK
jgi:hypothetical protein